MLSGFAVVLEVLPFFTSERGSPYSGAAEYHHQRAAAYYYQCETWALTPSHCSTLSFLS